MILNETQYTSDENDLYGHTETEITPLANEPKTGVIGTGKFHRIVVAGTEISIASAQWANELQRQISDLHQQCVDFQNKINSLQTKNTKLQNQIRDMQNQIDRDSWNN
jgi:TolA-binding protein